MSHGHLVTVLRVLSDYESLLSFVNWATLVAALVFEQPSQGDVTIYINIYNYSTGI